MTLHQYKTEFGTTILNFSNGFYYDIFDTVRKIDKYKHLSRKQRKRALAKDKLNRHNDW